MRLLYILVFLASPAIFAENRFLLSSPANPLSFLLKGIPKVVKQIQEKTKDIPKKLLGISGLSALAIHKSFTDSLHEANGLLGLPADSTKQLVQDKDAQLNLYKYDQQKHDQLRKTKESGLDLTAEQYQELAWLDMLESKLLEVSEVSETESQNEKPHQSFRAPNIWNAPIGSATEQEEYVEILERNPETPEVWYNLGCTLSGGGSVQVGNADYTEQNCYVRALELNPEIPQAWYNLGLTLFAHRPVQVNDRLYTARDSFLNALNLGLELPHVWHHLSRVVHPGQSVEVNGKIYTAQNIYVKALEKDSEFPNIWLSLCLTLRSAEEVKIGDRSYAAQNCYARVLELAPKNPKAWLSLYLTLNFGESVQIGDKDYTKQACYEEWLKANVS